MAKSGEEPPFHRRPDPEDRPWTHPSELRRFDALVHFSLPPLGRRLPVVLLLVGVLLGVVGVSTLAGFGPSGPSSAAFLVSRHSLDSLAGNVRRAATSTVEVVDIDADSGRRRAASALIIGDGSEAITTAALSPGGSLAASRDGQRVAVRVLGLDTTLGVTVLSLSPRQAPTPIGDLPDNAVVTALSPELGADHGDFDVAATLLGDPVTTVVPGRTSYVETNQSAALVGRTGSIAINNAGAVVGLLNVHNRWLSATYAVSASVLWRGAATCRARLGVTVTSASGGGALIVDAGRSRDLRVNDVIRSVNGYVIDDANALLAQLYITSGHSRPTIDVVRAGALISLHPTVGCGP